MQVVRRDIEGFDPESEDLELVLQPETVGEKQFVALLIEAMKSGGSARITAKDGRFIDITFPENTLRIVQ